MKQSTSFHCIFYNLHGEIRVWCLCDLCVCLDAYHQLTNSFVEEGELLHSVGHHRKSRRTKRYNCLSSVDLNIFACQRLHCLLTVRHCSSVEEQLSWLDCNGKHTGRLVTNQNVSGTVGYWACLPNFFVGGLQLWSWWDWLNFTSEILQAVCSATVNNGVVSC